MATKETTKEEGRSRFSDPKKDFMFLILDGTRHGHADTHRVPVGARLQADDQAPHGRRASRGPGWLQQHFAHGACRNGFIAVAEEPLDALV